ncbi:MAG: HlyD family efflux transporter periplasmic adaptor subunit [Bacteroidales bacterium]|nr:HlyD family efflux transporter periplasmic adaptor subunit [Bacteroidales bacterium]
MNKNLSYLIIPFLFFSCSNGDREADAWGNFEATEITVSSETNGRILQFPVNEGEVVIAGEKIALTDTILYSLQLKELHASKMAVQTKIKTIDSQTEILKQQINNLQININRIEKMLKDEAATKKQYDDLTGQVKVLERQVYANSTQKISVRSELAVLETKGAQLNEQLKRCYIIAPSPGTVIQKYGEEGEITTAGRPVVKIADLTVMKLKVYVSGAMLYDIKIGENCKARIDKGKDEYKTFDGAITKISNKAEFTPKIIQTKEERVSMVYAVIIEVVNDGSIKSGMPGEVIFNFSDPDN